MKCRRGISGGVQAPARSHARSHNRGRNRRSASRPNMNTRCRAADCASRMTGHQAACVCRRVYKSRPWRKGLYTGSPERSKAHLLGLAQGSLPFLRDAALRNGLTRAARVQRRRRCDETRRQYCQGRLTISPPLNTLPASRCGVSGPWLRPPKPHWTSL